MPASPRAKRTPSTTGNRSPKHRGHRPEQQPAKKARWSADERVARGRTADRHARTGDEPKSTRPDWEPRGRAAGERPARPSRDDRLERDARPARGRDERAPRYDRDSRPQRDGREERGDRFDRDARTDRAPRFDRDARPERAPRFDRDARPERGDRFDRERRPESAGRFDRDSRAPRDDRGDRFERRDRTDRAEGAGRFPRAERGERTGFGARPPREDRGDRFERPARAPRVDRDQRVDRDSRPRRSEWDRAERRARPEREDRGYHVDRHADRPARDHDGARFEPREDVVLERLEAQTTTAAEAEGVTFADLGLGQNICVQLAAQGAERPFPIQAATIPDVIAGRDVLGRGRTGSGKTIAFGAPLVERLLALGGSKNRKPGRAPRALILAPTRELAAQIDRTVQPIARSVGLFTVTIVGGVAQHRQTAGLQRGVDIVIATPGRLEDLVEQGHLDLSQILITVLDEADHMCDLGFLEPVQRILRQVRPNGQRLLFSATLDRGVSQLVQEFLVDPQVHQVEAEDDVVDIDHRVLVIDQRDKSEIIRDLVDGEGKVLVFSRTRAFAEQIAEELSDSGIPAASLHGDLNQAKRTRNLERLTSGRVRVLVATDVAARGIHVDDIELVIQADAPDEYKTYLHRAGRTGRAGKKGTVVTLITRARRRRMSELLGRAEIDADETEVRVGDTLLADLAGR